MLKLFSSSPLSLGIAPDGICLLKAGKDSASTRVLAEYQAASPQALPDLLNGLRAKLSGAEVQRNAVNVVLADQWARLFMATPPQNAVSREDCRAAAMLRYQELYGESLKGWQLRADWDARHPFLACALPEQLISSLKELATEYRWTLVTIAPQFVSAWNRWHGELKDNAWFGVALGNRLNVGVIEQGRLRAVNMIQASDGAWRDEQWMPAQLAREALRHSVSAPEQLRMCGFLAGVPAGRMDIAPGCKRLDAVQAASAGTAAAVLARLGAPA